MCFVQGSSGCALCRVAVGVLCTGSRVAVGVLCAGSSSVKDSGCCNCALCVQALLGAVTVCSVSRLCWIL